MVKKISILLATLLCSIHIAVSADGLYKADVMQMHCFSDILRTYVDLSDKDSNPIEKPKRADVIGYIDGTSLTTQTINRFGDTDEGTADIFLVDVSGSIKDSQLVQVKNAIKTWASNMKPNDRIAVVAFGENIETLTDFSGDINTISAAADKLTNKSHKTQLFGGISHALTLASRYDTDLPKRKNIILITDGVNDYSGGISENDLYASLKSSLIPVYSLWMSHSLANTSKGKATINSVTEYSGGKMYDMADKSIDTVYGWVKDNINNSYTVDFSYDGIKPDNNSHKFSIKVAENGRVFENSVDFIMKTSEEKAHIYSVSQSEDNNSEENDDSKNNFSWLIILAALILLAGGASVAIILFIKNKNKDEDSFIIPPIQTPPVQYTNTMENKTVQVGYTPASDDAKTVYLTPVSSGRPETVHITTSVLVGRSSQCEFVIENDTVSGKHAVITYSSSKLYIDDMGSVNGTLVNGRLVNTVTELKNNDLVTFGNEEYKISF